MHVIGALVKAGEYEEALDFRGEMIEQLGAEWEWDVKRDVDRGLVRAMEGDERWEDEVEKIVRDNPSAFE
jgi:pentatricopeptide repeat protein